jgi:hypothetical protein
MTGYNGFTTAQRNRAQRWLNQEWSVGRLARPSKCVACGQTEGVIDAHAEDYSEPFAAGKTDGHHLCFTCHMMLHCRFREPDAWDRYRSAIEAGAMFEPFRIRNWWGFKHAFLGLAIRRRLAVARKSAGCNKAAFDWLPEGRDGPAVPRVAVKSAV